MHREYFSNRLVMTFIYFISWVLFFIDLYFFSQLRYGNRVKRLIKSSDTVWNKKLGSFMIPLLEVYVGHPFWICIFRLYCNVFEVCWKCCRNLKFVFFLWWKYKNYKMESASRWLTYKEFQMEGSPPLPFPHSV